MSAPTPKPGPVPGQRPGIGPVPHDPRQPHVTPEQVTQAVNEILAEAPEGLAEEAAQLSRAHAVLHEALQ